MPVASGQVSQSTSQKPATSVAVDVHQCPVTGPSEMPAHQPTMSGTRDLPDCDLELETDLTSVYPEEKGEVSDWEVDRTDLSISFLKSKTRLSRS